MKWYYHNIGSGNNTYTCIEHAGCTFLARVRVTSVGAEPGGWCVETSGQHSGEVTTFDGRGIHPIFIEYIDEQLNSGTTPKRTYNLLLTKYEDQEHRRLFPSVQQIRTRAMTLSRKNDSKHRMEKVSDLNEWTQAHILPSILEDAKNVPAAQLVILHGGVFQLESSNGFCFSAPSVLYNAVRARVAWGDTIPLVTDGTYKLMYNGWVLIAFGTHTVYYNIQTCKIQHKFVPISFMFCETECTEAYARLFSATKITVEFLFDYPLQASNCQSDREE